MNILLWIVQVALAVLSFAGGAYKVFSFDELAKMPATGALSRGDGARSAYSRCCAPSCWSSQPPRSGCPF
jgi:hypothetical protein